MVPIAEHITGPGCIAEGLEHYEKLGGKGVHVIPAKQMYPFHWLMNDLEAGGSEGEDHCFLIQACIACVRSTSSLRLSRCCYSRASLFSSGCSCFYYRIMLGLFICYESGSMRGHLRVL
jgi:hypothetical protein